MVAACRYALFVEVLDVPHDPMAADPDRIEAPPRARRALPPPSPVGDRKGPEWLASPSLFISQRIDLSADRRNGAHEPGGHGCPTWDDRRSSAPADVRAGELALEREVSKTIGAMRCLWLCIDDEPGHQSERGYIERNAIALLSNYGKEPLDPASPTWLGHCCNRPRVRGSICGTTITWMRIATPRFWTGWRRS
jgi:hypothetical protein